MKRLEGRVDKGWGYEDIWCTNDKYCSKFMYFNQGAKFSMHFHKEKDETWAVVEGKFLLRWIDTKTANLIELTIEKGDVWHNPPMVPHQLECLEQGCILEVSTPDSIEDNYRVMPGDSQK